MRIDNFVIAPLDREGTWGAMIIGDAETINEVEELCQKIQEKTEGNKNE